MKKEKLYFESIDDTTCQAAEYYINDARLEGLEKITLVEAIPDNDNPDHIWCRQHGEVVERNICNKKECTYYESTSGRGRCKNKGSLYSHGEEVEFDVPKNPPINHSILKIGDKVVYNGLGKDRTGTVVKINKKTICIKMAFSRICIGVKGNPSLEELGLKIINDEQVQP